MSAEELVFSRMVRQLLAVLALPLQRGTLPSMLEN